ncbi:hypothetical protein DIPPA_16607 [Diplonema papillatum]|nr:hypothetical protein DIPPA_16607 [Diplonema papillatum]
MQVVGKEAAAKLSARTDDMTRWCTQNFGGCHDGTVEVVRRVAVEFLQVPGPALAGLDMGRMLVLLMNAEKEKPAVLQAAMVKHGLAGYLPPLPVPPPPLTESGESDVAKLKSLLVQASSTIEQQKTEIQSLRARMLAIEASQARPGGDFEMVDEAYNSREAMFAAARYDWKDVRSWVHAVEHDPNGLIRDVHSHFVAGYLDRQGGDALRDAYERLRSWVLGIAVGSSGWSSNDELTRLGNELLQDLRLHHTWCVKRIPRGRLLREMASSSDDPLERALAKVETERAKSGPRKWDAAPRFRGGKGSKGGKGWYPGPGNAMHGGK